jgi:ABC-type uncharacterized transport system auxiliary subunit
MRLKTFKPATCNLQLATMLLFLVFLTGCAGSPHYKSESTETYKALDVSTALKFEDVPVPAGFAPVVRDSFVFENDVLRVGIMKYAGRVHPDHVVNFYKDQMSLYNWRFLNLVEYQRRIMSFERDDQTCTILIEPSGMSTLLTISVAPKAGRATTYKSIRRD